MLELNAMPDVLAAGTSCVIRRSYTNYPANAGWGLKLLLAGKSVTAPIDAAPSGADHVISITDTISAPLLPGMYQWTDRVTKGSEIYDVATGRVLISRNLATALAGDAQSSDEKELELVQAEIKARLTGGTIEGYTVESESVSKTNLEHLYAREKTLRRRITRARKGTTLSTIKLGFGAGR
jgi:hypothetical protein